MEARHKDTEYCSHSFVGWEAKQVEKVCAFDLDNTLANSTPHWIKYANLSCNTKCKNLDELKNTLSYNAYRNLKFRYRSGLSKLSILPTDNASKITKVLKKFGYTIIIITARPFETHRNLWSLTTTWLMNNDIVYDGVIWGKDKHIKVMTEVENLSFIVEDHRYIANTCAKFGMKVYLLDNIYNQGELNSNVVRIKNLMEINEK